MVFMSCRLVTLILVVSIFSCAKKQTTQVDGIPSPVRQENDWLVVEDGFAEAPLKISKNFRNDYSDFTVVTKAYVNSFNDDQFDTLYILGKNMDSLKFLSIKENYTLVSLDLKSDRISLEKEITLGMNKTTFYKKFSQLDTISLKPDKIRVWYFGSSIDFIFANDKLSKVNWEVGEID